MAEELAVVPRARKDRPGRKALKVHKAAGAREADHKDRRVPKVLRAAKVRRAARV